MNTETLARSTFVLDKTTAADLAYISRRLGQSRSELVREMLGPPVSELAAIVRQIPESPTPADAEVFRRGLLGLLGDTYEQGLTAIGAGRD